MGVEDCAASLGAGVGSGAGVAVAVWRAAGVWAGSGVGVGDAVTSGDSLFAPDSAVAVRVGSLVAVSSVCVGVETGLETKGTADSTATEVCVGLGGGKTSRLPSAQPVAIRTGSAVKRTSP